MKNSIYSLYKQGKCGMKLKIGEVEKLGFRYPKFNLTSFIYWLEYSTLLLSL